MKQVLLFSVVISFTFSAMSQSSKDFNRQGIVLGVAAGLANSSMRFPNENQQHSNLGVNWKVGYMMRPKLALLLNGSVSIYKYNLSGRSRLRDFGGVSLAGQYFPVKRLWLLGGIGVGTDAPVFFDLKTDNKDELKYYAGFGLVSGVGYEFYRKNNFALDIQARVTFSKVNLSVGQTNGLNTSMLLGITFY